MMEWMLGSMGIMQEADEILSNTTAHIASLQEQLALEHEQLVRHFFSCLVQLGDTNALFLTGTCSFCFVLFVLFVT